MYISGVRPQGEIYNYNSIKMNVLRKENVEVDSADMTYDVKKAISDMAKDFTLQQYQYFVGDGVHAISKGKSDISFRTGENFVL